MTRAILFTGERSSVGVPLSARVDNDIENGTEQSFLYFEEQKIPVRVFGDNLLSYPGKTVTGKVEVLQIGNEKNKKIFLVFRNVEIKVHVGTSSHRWIGRPRHAQPNWPGSTFFDIPGRNRKIIIAPKPR